MKLFDDSYRSLIVPLSWRFNFRILFNRQPLLYWYDGDDRAEGENGQWLIVNYQLLERYGMALRGDLLQGKKVRLTAVSKDDLSTMANWWADTEFLRLYDSFPAFPKTADWLAKWLEDNEQGKTNFMMGIRPLNEDKLVGLAGLDGIIWSNGTSSVSIAIGEQDERGKGYGWEAMILLLDFAFRELNLHRVFLTVFGYNTPAIAMYEKLGFTYEGAHREHLHRDGQRFDMLLYGVLRREWEARSEKAE